ncbi:unnamed protein product [Brachionus calyciflorus]|uniref:Uncharacterized protein n=1 Tax=Brachionus calyciflorus TaxID=104777 RepID=A0A814FB37_9BILA|nr:unnamed protein product [Brachionus calyciflorus]
MANKVFSEGATMVRASLFLEDRIKKDKEIGYVSLKTIQKIKSEKINQDKISNFFEIDCKSIKTAYEELYPASNENQIKGYIQGIKSDPFGILLSCYFQIKIWSVVQRNAPIWFFDATGCILKDIPGKSKTLLFSIVCHDVSSKTIIPVADFFTNSLSTRTIANFLNEIKDLFEANIDTRVECRFPKIVVLDFTWANINAFLEAFNRVSIFQYLKWAEELIINGNFKIYNLMPVKVMICCTHFLKIIIVKLKKKLKQNEIFCSKDFIFSFTLLQNSRSFKEFKDILIDLFYIYNSKFLSENLIERTIRIEQKIKKREKDDLNFEISNESENSVFLFEEFTIGSLKKDSPFTKYFNSLFLIHQKNLDLHEKSGFLINKYYNPELFKLCEETLYILPLWTGILLSFENFKYGDGSRISNNPVEGHFNNLRNNILKINKKQKMIRKLMPSQYISRVFKYILFKYYEVFDSEYEKTFTQRALSRKTGDKFNEKWSHDNNCFYREKGFYYKPNESFLHLKEINSVIRVSEKNKKNLKRIDFFKSFLPKNGGYLNDKKISISNTCSIDYFLLIISYLWFNNSYYSTLKTKERGNSLYDDFEITSNYITDGEWMEARLEWVKRINLKPKSANNEIFYDCMLSVFDSFYLEYSEIQQFSWNEKMLKRKKENILVLDSKFLDNKNKRCQSYLEKKRKCDYLLEISETKFVFGFPALLIIINNYNEADVKNLPREIFLKKERYLLFGANLHSENHFKFLLFEDDKFYLIDNLDTTNFIAKESVDGWQITNIFMNMSNATQNY